MRIFLIFVFFLGLKLANCNLASADRTCGPEKKLKISETVLANGTSIDDYQIYFVSDNNQIIFIRTLNGALYKTTDEGKTWEIQTVPEKMAHIKDFNGGILRLFHSETPDKIITLYFLGSDRHSLWISKDSGQTYTYSDAMPSDVSHLYMHPMYSGIVIAKRSVKGSIELWKGTNFGKTWEKMIDLLPLQAPVYWSIFPDTDPNRIYTMRSSGAHYEIIFTEDYFKTITVLPIKYVLWFSIFAPNKFIAKVCADDTCADKEMYLSEDGGKVFHLAEIPEPNSDTVKEQDYYVWEITDDAIWVYVHRGCSSSNCWGDLYHSNAADRDFTLSLPYMKQWEFTKFNSLDGIYVSNQFVTKSGIPESHDTVRSLITFNKGANWSVIAAPELDANGQPTNCSVKDGCSLHIHGWGTGNSFSYFYSIPNAVGLMIGSGNIGRRLTNREDEMATYVSFNGGMKWQEVRKHDYVPEIGDSGAIIVLVKETGETDEIVYTIDNGDEWRSCIFTDQKLDISNIRVAPGWDSRRFIMYGQRINNGVSTAVVFQIDFDDELPNKCTDTDYTLWSPKNEHGNCVLGKATYYNMRNKTCYYGLDYQPEKKHEPCPCTEDDYECDHCFTRLDLASRCSLQCMYPGVPAPPAECKDVYEVEMGYRLVDGDVCKGNGEKKPKGIVPCLTPIPINPSQMTSGLHAIPIIIICIVALLCLLGVFLCLYKYNESFYNCVSYTFGIESGSFVREQGQSLVQE